MSKPKRKTFKYNGGYLNFYKKMKDKIEILSVKILQEKIILEYVDKEV